LKPFFLTTVFILFFFASAISQLQYDATVIRDQWGVPHIYGDTDADAAFGLAWAHCEDDFEDIQLTFMGTKNLLGRQIGPRGALFDYGMQFLEIDSIVTSRYESDLSLAFRNVLKGYAQGVNRFAALHPKKVIRKQVFPITGHDIIKMYTFNTSLMAGLGMAIKAVRDDKVAEYTTINDLGSNAIAVSPEQMIDEKGYLLVNTHLPIEGQRAWYEAHINSNEGWNMLGALFPGGVTAFIGTNPHLGWCHTFNFHNFGDVYLLKINPKNKSQYEYDGEWRNFRTGKAKLVVKLFGQPIPVKRKLFFSEYGPVYKSRSGDYYAFRFPGYTDIRAAEQWFNMNKASNLNEFEAALSMEAVPLFNTVYADIEGNILLHSGGKVPRRDPGLDWQQPIVANTSAYKWEAFLDYEELPTIKNPACGYVYNANQTPLEATGDSCEWKGDFVGLQRFTYNRGEQFRDMLHAHDGPFTEALLDTVKFFTGYVKNGSYQTKFKVLFNLDHKQYPDITYAIEKIKRWNLEGTVDNRDAALMLIIHDYLRQELDMTFGFLMIREAPILEEEAVRAVRYAQRQLLHAHGTLDIPLGQVQFYIRGDRHVPADGLRETARATDTKLFNRGKAVYKVVSGDGYMQKVRFTPQGPELNTINVYGASDDPESPHYDDQMELFSQHRYKVMTLDRAVIERDAERIYKVVSD